MYSHDLEEKQYTQKSNGVPVYPFDGKPCDRFSEELLDTPLFGACDVSYFDENNQKLVKI